MDAYDWHALLMLALPLEVVLALVIAGRRPLPRWRWWGPTLAAWGFLFYAFVFSCSTVCMCGGGSGEREMWLGLVCAWVIACLVRRWRWHFCTVLWLATTLLANQAQNRSNFHGRWTELPETVVAQARCLAPSWYLAKLVAEVRASAAIPDQDLPAGWLVENAVVRASPRLSSLVAEAHENAQRIECERCWHTWLTGRWRIVERERIAPWFTGGRAVDIPDRIEWRRR